MLYKNDEFYFVIYLRRCPKGVIYLRRCPKRVISKWLNCREQVSILCPSGYEPDAPPAAPSRLNPNDEFYFFI